MKYMGSKNRIAKHLKPILEKHLNGENWYVEPFVGGANMIDKIDYNKKIGADINEYLICFWNAIQKGWLPPKHITKEEYCYIKDNKDEDKKLTLWAGICCSFKGKWFGGYVGKVNTEKENRDYQKEAYSNVLKQIPNIKNVKFIHSDYKSLNIPPKSVIYCDPPYENTTKYKDNFNNKEFWDWCREKVKEGHYVYVSEYNAPEDFVCIWQKEVLNGLNKTKPVEKLFVHKSQNHV